MRNEKGRQEERKTKEKRKRLREITSFYRGHSAMESNPRCDIGREQK